MIRRAVLAALALVACGGGRARRTEVVVFAAASLRDVFTQLGEDFEREHPETDVVFHFAGTQELRTQLEHGAGADVFASADRRHMDALVEAGRVAAPIVFARNVPVVIVAPHAAETVRTFADLPHARHLVLGAPDVPIGRYAEAILERARDRFGADFPARVDARVVSREANVRQVATKVRLGEADAAIVYRSDAAGMPGVAVVAIPDDVNVAAEYPIAVLTDAAHPRLATAWIEHVRSPAGRRALEAAGFAAPDEE